MSFEQQDDETTLVSPLQAFFQSNRDVFLNEKMVLVDDNVVSSNPVRGGLYWSPESKKLIRKAASVGQLRDAPILSSFVSPKTTKDPKKKRGAGDKWSSSSGGSGEGGSPDVSPVQPSSSRFLPMPQRRASPTAVQSDTDLFARGASIRRRRPKTSTSVLQVIKETEDIIKQNVTWSLQDEVSTARTKQRAPTHNNPFVGRVRTKEFLFDTFVDTSDNTISFRKSSRRSGTLSASTASTQKPQKQQTPARRMTAVA